MKQLFRILQAILGLLLRHPILGVTLIPILPDGRVVLVKRRDNGLWGLPGGLVEWGETILVSAQRELKEETGLEIVGSPQVVGVYSEPYRDPRLHSVAVAIAVQVTGEMYIEDTLELSEIQAFSTTDLPPEPLAHDHAQQLQDFFKGKTVLR